MNINLTLIGQSIAFAIFVWFCVKYVWPPITEAMSARQKKIADGLSATDRASLDLELAQEKAAQELRTAKEEAAALIEQANKRATQIVEDSKVITQHRYQRFLDINHEAAGKLPSLEMWSDLPWRHCHNVVCQQGHL